MKRFLARHSALFILAGLCVVLAVYSPDFRGAANLKSVAQRTAVVGVIALGELLVVLAAGIDLSVGSVAAFGGMAGCLAVQRGLPWQAALPVGVAAGLCCGLFTGLLTTLGRMAPFITTLGMMMAARGMTLVVSGARPVQVPPPLLILGGTGTWGWWMPVAVMVALAVLFSLVLRYTQFGRALYAVGGNAEAARLSGIPVGRVRVIVYSVSGAMAGLGGIMLAARSSVASPTAAEMHELYAIAACVIGGASLTGGEGGAVAAIAGALIMSVLYNFCNLRDISVDWQQVLVGALLVTLVFYDTWRKRRAGLIRE